MTWRAVGAITLGILTMVAAACGGDDDPTFGGGASTSSGVGGGGGEGGRGGGGGATTSSTGGGGSSSSSGGVGGEGGVCTPSGETCDSVPTCGPLDDGCGNVSDCSGSCEPNGDPGNHIMCNAAGWCQCARDAGGDPGCAVSFPGSIAYQCVGLPANKIPPSCQESGAGLCCQCCDGPGCTVLCNP